MSRPRKPVGELKDFRTVVHFNRRQFDMLHRWAESVGLSVSAAARFLIHEALEERGFRAPPSE
jgi:hypothetical protein